MRIAGMAPPKLPKIGIKNLWMDWEAVARDTQIPGLEPTKYPNIQNFKQVVSYHVKMTAHLLDLRLKYQKWKEESGHLRDFQKKRKANEKTLNAISDTEKHMTSVLSQLADLEIEIEGMKKEGKTIAKKLSKVPEAKALAMVTNFDLKARRTEKQIKIKIIEFTVQAGALEKKAKAMEKTF